MLKVHNPQTIIPPLSNYSHGVEVPPNARWLLISGQVAIAPDGSIPDGIEAQMELVFTNIEAVLDSASMVMADVVRLNVYMTAPDHFSAFRAVRDRHGAQKSASTAIVISALARPELLVEIEAVAARSTRQDNN